MTAPVRAGATPYRAVWRWHFVAGLLVAPVLLVLAVTGALYLFQHEIERTWYADLMNVSPVRQAKPAAAQEAAVLVAWPAARIKSVEWPHDSEQASTWRVVGADGVARDVFVDPSDARVIGAIDTDTRLMNVISDLHGELLLGRFGDTVVELAASWVLVLMGSGMYLWWPRRWKWRGVLVPRLHLHGRRFWRDLHAVPAVFNLVLVAFLVLSGLPWSGFWGEQLARLGTLNAATAPSPNFHAPPARDGTPADSHHHAADERALPWSVRQAAVPNGRGAGIGIAQVMEVARERGLTAAGPRLRVFYPADDKGVFTVSFVPARAQDQRTLYIDPRDGRLMRDIGWNEYSALAKGVEWGVMAHMGRQFGSVNRWLALTVCLVLILTVVSGVVMWWRRRPQGGIGVPDAAGQRLPRGLVVLLLALGLLFPLAGLSMLGVVAIQAAVQSRRGTRPSARM